MSHPHLTIDLSKIEHNARVIVDLCRGHGIEVTGVTKATHGDAEVARAMLRGGVTGIGESHLENVRRLKDAEIDAPVMLLTVPSLSDVGAVICTVDVSLNSEISVLDALSQAALNQGNIHDVLVMVDLGDLREGVLPQYLDGFMHQAAALPGIRIKGLGANLTCFGGVVPSRENMGRLVQQARETEEAFGLKLEWISGGNSSALKLIASDSMPSEVNHARIGEAILLGCETTHREPWPDTHQDAFVLKAEVVEAKEKPSQPKGELAEDAFGHVPRFEDLGDIDHALVNIGREDVDVEGLTPVDDRLHVLGGTSGYVALDITKAEGEIEVGSEITFTLNYAALVVAMGSEYIEKRHIGGDGA